MPENGSALGSSGDPATIVVGFSVACGAKPGSEGLDTHDNYVRLSFGWKTGGKTSDVDVTIPLAGPVRTPGGGEVVQHGDDTPEIAKKIQRALAEAAKTNPELANHLKNGDLSVQTDNLGPGFTHGRVVVKGSTHVDAGTNVGKLRLELYGMSGRAPGTMKGAPPIIGTGGPTPGGPHLKFRQAFLLKTPNPDPTSLGYYLEDLDLKKGKPFSPVRPLVPSPARMPLGTLVIGTGLDVLAWDNRFHGEEFRIPFRYVFTSLADQASEIHERLQNAGIEVWRDQTLVIPVRSVYWGPVVRVGIEMVYDPNGAYGNFPWRVAIVSPWSVQSPIMSQEETGRVPVLGANPISPASVLNQKRLE